MSRNFEVNDKNYELSLNKNEDNKVSVEISSNELSNEGSNNVVDVIYLAENKFKAVLPDGEKNLYLIESGNVISKLLILMKLWIYSRLQTLTKLILQFSISLYICALFIMIFMIFDDYLTIKAIYRLMLQFFIAGLMIVMSGEYLYQIGNIFGIGEIKLGIFAIPFTIFCVVGLMNAFNMIDGLNGICASLALIPLMYVTFLGKFSYGLWYQLVQLLVFWHNLGFWKKERVF